MPARPPDYLDFDLELTPGGDGSYHAAVLASPKGEASARVRMPAAGADLENVILKLGRTRSGVRALGSPQQQLARSFGSSLYDAVFAGEVGTCFRRSLDQAEQEGKGLRVRLRLADVPELADVPWEFLYAAGLGRFVVLSAQTPIVRYLDLPREVDPLTVSPPLRVLLAVSAPRNLPPLDTAAEVTRIQAALADLVARGLVVVDPLPTATLAQLRRALRRQDYHGLHVIGHGGFDAVAGGGVLAFEDEQGMAHLVSGENLGTLLHDHRTLRLAVLNACEGARQSRTDPFSGVAQSLVRQGLPAVVAMQFEITDTAATCFAQEFYAALADGYPVDAATAQARLAVFSTDNDVEWGTPVLYLRARDGRIFQVPAAASPAGPPAGPPQPPAPAGAPGPAPAGRSAPGRPPIVVTIPAGPDPGTAPSPGPDPGTAPSPGPHPGTAPTPPPPPRPTPSARPWSGRRLRPLALAGAALALLVVGYVALNRVGDAPTPAPTATRPASPSVPTTVAPSVPPTPADVPRLGFVGVARGSATVDGRAGEWAKVTPIPGNELVAGRETGVRATWRLMADDTAFYALAEVRDAALRPPDPRQPSQAWRGDGVSFELGPSGVALAAEDGPRSNDAHYLFGITDQEQGGPALVCVNPSDPRNRTFVSGSPNQRVSAVWRPTADGYLVEIAVPWAVTGIPGPYAGHMASANFDVSDAAPDGALAGMHSTNPRRSAAVQAFPVYWQPLFLDG
ncbi:MAG: CHAT domain-containing protein [Dermatophilaceae bacterium]